MEKTQTTVTPVQTQKIGEEFGHELAEGQIIVLTGELGAGKTTFVQGIAKALSVKSRIISPTFVLVRRHKGKIGSKQIRLYHIDLYRLEGKTDMESLGLEDIFEDTKGIFLIEWGEKHGDIRADWEVAIKSIDENKREIKIIKANE